MEERSIADYVFVGTQVRYFTDMTAGRPIHGREYVLPNLRTFLDALDRMGLNVTARLARTKLKALMKELEETPADAVLTSDQADLIAKSMLQVTETLYAEAEGVKAFIAEDRRYPIESLLHKPHSLFAAGVFHRLPDIAQSDVRDACRCITFNLPTAAAFHLTRATEDVLRVFYCSVVRQKRVSPLMWGPMVKGLRARRQPPPEVLLNNLDNLRVSFRNPTQHPEKVYEIDEAQDLLNLSIDVMNRMVKMLPA